MASYFYYKKQNGDEKMEQNIPIININPLKDKIEVRKFDHKCYIYQFEYQKADDSHVVYFKYDGVGHCEDSSCMIPLTDDNRLLLVDLLTQYVGTHNVELYEVDTEGQYVKSSEIFELVVKPIVNGGNVQEVHDPDLDLLYIEYKKLYDILVLKEEDLTDLIADIEYKRDHGQFDGFSPLVSIQRVSDGVVISITDKNGVHVSKVSDGEEGTPGTPGFSPSAKVNKNGKTTTLTVTDKDGTTTAEIYDGQDGYTPVKGRDYFTQSDKNEIINEVVERVPEYDDTEIRQDISDLQEEDLSIRQKISEIEMAKFPNVTIFGQPTINQGQISNFSSNNYCQFPFVVNFQNQRFLIDFEFTTGTDVSNQHNILDSNFGLAFAVRQNRFVVAISTNGTNWNVGEGVGTHVVAPNTTYRIKMAWNGTDTFTLAYSEDGGATYVTDITKPLTSQPYPKQMYIGISSDKTHNFNGIVNLNYASLTIADKLVWQGMDDVGIATRLAVDLSNIDDKGIDRINDLIKEGTFEVTEGVKDLLEVTTPSYSSLNGYIRYDGNIGISGSWSHSTPIKLEKGKMIIYKGTGYSNSVAMISLTDEQGSKYIPVVVSTDSKEHVFKYTTTEDCFVSISFNLNVYNPNVIIGNYERHVLLNFEDSFEVLKTDVLYKNEKTDIDFNNSISGHYINFNGVYSATQYFNMTNPIRLKKGTIIKATCTGYLSNVAIISLFKNGAYIPLVISDGNDTKLYEWEVEEDGDYIISFQNNRAYSGYVLYEHDLNQIETELSYLRNKKNNNFWSYNIWKGLCIGDSLTSGATYSEEWGEIAPKGSSIDQNYPRILGRMLDSEITNGGTSGATSTSWLNNELQKYTLSNYDTFFIWLGTNSGLDNSAEETAYRNIINTIKANNNSCLIVLIKIFATSSGTVSGTNRIIDEIANEYGFPVIDNSDIGHLTRPDLHANVPNPHFGKGGNIFIANRIIENLGEWFEEDHLRSEYGYTPRTN